MDSLRSLFVQNQNNLDRLRVRTRYFSVCLLENKSDFHRQYGPYADFWDDWYDQTGQLQGEVNRDIAATSDFVDELKEFIICADSKPAKRKSKVVAQRYVEMNTLAKEALDCQKDMIHIADTRIAEHKEFTERLLLVESIEGLTDD